MLADRLFNCFCMTDNNSKIASTYELQANIASLRTELEAGDSALTYLNEFEQVVKNELLYIGSIPYDRLQTEEQKLKEEHVNSKMLQVL